MDWIPQVQCPMAVRRAHGNGPSGSMNCWGVLEQLSNCWFLKKDLAPWT
jgi:hypothetical protein